MPVVKGGSIIRGDDIRRFWSKTKPDGACIVWTGARAHYGHGKFMVGTARRQKTIHAHRWIYERVFGPVGDLEVRHDCDNPPCVALQHLSPGTQMQNVHDAIDRGRRVFVASPDVIRELERRVASGESVPAAARAIGIKAQTAYSALARTKKATGR